LAHPLEKRWEGRGAIPQIETPLGGIAFETSYDLTLAPEAKGFIGERVYEV